MKFIKWKSLSITCLVCMLPILLGIALWDNLPDTMAIHFNINNEPDNFASKGFVVFGMPFLMVFLQIFCCINIDKEKARKINRFIGFETVIMGFLALITIFLPPISTVIWLLLLIVYAIISVVYGIKIGRKEI